MTTVRRPPKTVQRVEIATATLGQAGDLWAEKDEKITFGYINAQGERIPGILEIIDQHSKSIMLISRIDAWALRIAGVIVLAHFLGLTSAHTVLSFFGVR